MGNREQIIESDFYLSAERRITNARIKNTAADSRLDYLERYIDDTKNKQKNLAGEPRTFWKKMIILERKQTISSLLNEYIADKDIFSEEMPSRDFFFESRQKLEKGRVLKKYTPEEYDYMRRYLDKTIVVRKNFSKWGWNDWRKLAYLNRIATMERLLKDYVSDDYMPRG